MIKFLWFCVYYFWWMLYNQHIHTDNGPIRIGTLYEKWKNNEILPKIPSFNENKTFWI